ncbi:dihydropteroate synthase [Corynebacterium casei]|uniref:Dihydropteroate synthase n=1 Tax=Corynebacterium casei UCMA 3821 TaxID=1110505 RepID=G7HYB6_9CORY|nr:dihydropteroate synthase [Corynebacterium casei]MDN5705493.1 dihydropteroate synthase [Corynebacterium casei]MDN5728102.1 dihydropteroate synthase [Corynebacterium casei]MDN5739701.1 dihydropteroate synthase [Corynebacterium casei]MDN5783398.1 dihydropteroate synthase [Corynebacterium casei]MDN5798897.1 dihydropteroate synthase [Corynebacterium casei]
MQVADICPDAAAKRTLVMGIVNVTEDSFSDGGKWIDIDRAIAHGRELVAQGADMIDVGGESTRPGATRVEPEMEKQRVAPVVQALAEEGIVVSVDTMRASVAEAAVEAGALLLNDVSGGLADDNMYSVMADSKVPVCLMHWRTVRFGDAAGSADHNGDVVKDVHATLARLTDNAIKAGVTPELITLDPGLGFAKTPQDNWALLKALPEFIAGHYPILVGASRKRFLAAIREDRGMEHGPHLSDPATAAVTALSAQLGAWAVRVHDVPVSRDAVDVAAAWAAGPQYISGSER